IHTVEAKLPNRRFVEGQHAAALRIAHTIDRELREAQKIARSGELTKDKLTGIKADIAGQRKHLSELRTIEQNLLAHGDKHAASQIEKLRQIAAKKLNVTVNTYT